MTTAVKPNDRIKVGDALADIGRQVGFSDDYPIGISPRGSLLDGAHRMGIALADNVEQVFVDIRMGKRLRSFERRWFVDHGFDQEALERMDLELDRVMAHTGVDTVQYCSYR